MDVGHVKSGKGYIGPKEQDEFEAWRLDEMNAVGARGADPNFEVEERYVRSLTDNVLRSHVCYREVDAYTDCLVKKKVVAEADLFRSEVNMKRAKEKCASEVKGYLGCMDSTKNHETVIQAAAEHVRCDGPRKEAFVCLERHSADKESQAKNCRHLHLGLIRCGLNHLWEEYWRGLTGFGHEEELHLFDAHREAKRKAAQVAAGTKVDISKRI